MRNQLIKVMQRHQVSEMIYIDNSGVVSKRKIRVLSLNNEFFSAYCFLRKTKRTFKIDGVLAIVPVINRESMVI